MSLWVHLHSKNSRLSGGSGIVVREDGETKEISREEWDAKFPGREPIILNCEGSDDVFSANITHNLGKMAFEAGIYEYVWRPEEIGITKAGQLINPLRAGIALLKSDPDRFKKFEPSNGWGTLEAFVPWLDRYLCACEKNPEAEVSASR